MYGKVMMYNVSSGAIPWQMHDFLSEGNSNVCIVNQQQTYHHCM